MLCYIGDNSNEDEDDDDDAFSVGGLESGLEIAAPATWAGSYAADTIREGLLAGGC